MPCRLFGAKSLPEPVLPYHQLDPWKHISMKFCPETKLLPENAFKSVVCKVVILLSLLWCASYRGPDENEAHIELIWNKHYFINSSPPSAAHIHPWFRSALVQIMACHLFAAKPLSKPLLPIGSLEITLVEILIEIQTFHSRKCNWKCCLPKWPPFCPVWCSFIQRFHLWLACLNVILAFSFQTFFELNWMWLVAGTFSNGFTGMECFHFNWSFLRLL